MLFCPVSTVRLLYHILPYPEQKKQEKSDFNFLNNSFRRLLTAVSDPELGCTAFTVEQTTYTRILSGGWIYNRVAKKGVLVSGKAGDKPMFDTGSLYNDFDYEITSR